LKKNFYRQTFSSSLNQTKRECTHEKKRKKKLIHYLLNIPRVFTICRDVWERAGHSAQEMNAPREYDDQHFTKGKERKEIYFVGARV
jgi:hypothetical protein